MVIRRHKTHTKGWKELGLFFFREDKVKRGDLDAEPIYLIGGYREDKARVFLNVHSKIMRDNGCKLEIPISYWEIIFHNKDSQALKWFTQRGCRTSILKGNCNATGGDSEQPDPASWI